MKRLAATAAGLLLMAGLFLYSRRSELPEAPAARVSRAGVIQLLTTNGKVEPLESFAAPVRAPLVVLDVKVREGDAVRRGQSLAAVDDAVAREALARAQAQLEIARADRSLLERGGSAVELGELEAALARARLDKEALEKEAAALERLVARQAVPRAELFDHQQKLRKIQAEMAALERKRSSLLGPEDRERILARIREAETAVSQAATALQRTEIRAPIDGILYKLSLRPGAFYNAGDLAAHVGVLHKVRVRVLVDEPELGRVQVGQPVHLTWDALPGRSWQGAVERLPSIIETSGARSVGEVLCTIDNPERHLLPNVTVSVDIRTGSAENALTIPREAVLREDSRTFVLVVEGDGVIARRLVRVGIRDLHRVEVVEGLTENQVVLLPAGLTLTPGQKVRPKVAK